MEFIHITTITAFCDWQNIKYLVSKLKLLLITINEALLL